MGLRGFVLMNTREVPQGRPVNFRLLQDVLLNQAVSAVRVSFRLCNTKTQISSGHCKFLGI